MSNRRDDIDEAADCTCAWVLHHKSYKDWQQNRQGLLWIKGNPGTGKSTLMKNISEKKKLDTESITIAYYFSARGAEIQKQSNGLFQALLHQLFISRPYLSADFTKEFKRRQNLIGEYDKRKWVWSKEDIRRHFERAILESSKSESIHLYVDALDESGEDTAREILSYFDRLLIQVSQQNGSLKVCLASRHHPLEDLVNGNEIRMEEENHNDIQAYINQRLGLDPHSRYYHSATLQIATIERAAGNFQWVCLVVPRILKLCSQGLNQGMILEAISQTPKELHDLYTELLRETDGEKKEDREALRRLMTWVCFAIRPLTTSEVYHAIALDLENPIQNINELKVADNLDLLVSRIRSLSRALLEIRTSSRYSGCAGEPNTVRFIQPIHQSVQDFMVDKGLSVLQPSIAKRLDGLYSCTLLERLDTFDSTTKAHFELSQLCILYLKTTDIKLIDPVKQNAKHLSRSVPLLGYVLEEWPVHLKALDKQAGDLYEDLVSTNKLPEDSSVSQWVNLMFRHGLAYMSLPTIAIRRPYLLQDHATLLRVAAAYGIAGLVGALLRNEKPANTMLIDIHGNNSLKTGNDWWDGLIYLASAADHLDVVLALLAEMQADINLRRSEVNVALGHAAARGFTSICEALLQQGRADINSRDEFGLAPLSLAAYMGKDECVKLLTARRQQRGTKPMRQ
ncbi:hypothetical protein AAFC00_001107 [Neodothiora populina]|uniref:NACHT domain-containing protein n=1 Tax=Neodothiora populina TaxID=2781224 RepID=A0ABR3PMT5_9PEZI